MPGIRRENQGSISHMNAVHSHTISPFSGFCQNISASTCFSQSTMASLDLQSKYITTQYMKCISTAKITTSAKFGPTCGPTGTVSTNGNSGHNHNMPTLFHVGVLQWWLSQCGVISSV